MILDETMHHDGQHLRVGGGKLGSQLITQRLQQPTATVLNC
jgi:hypothetical protein